MNDEQAETVLPLPLWIAILAILFCWPSMALSTPLFVAEAEGAVVTLYDEPCQLKEVVTNLPYRVVWVEKGKATEGCFGVRQDTGVVMAYFQDLTVVAMPIPLFKKLQSV